MIDEQGNIINQTGQIIFYFWELIHGEPPKFFPFSEYSMEWIKGNYKGDVFNFNPCEDDLLDVDGRLVNTMGYLIDRSDNIIDKQGDLVFSRELLIEKSG